MADTTNNGDPAAAQAADQQQAALLQQQQTQIEKKAIEAAQMQAQALAAAQEVAKVAAAAGVNIDTAGLITDFNQHINKEQPIAEKSNVPSCHSYSKEPRMKSYQIFRRRLSRIDIAISVYCSSNFMTFSSSNAKEEISTIVTANESEQSTSQPKATRHVFQALQYLLKLCSHPVLVIGESPPDYLVDHLKDIGMGSGDELHDLHHSPKLVALQEILHECGIGCEISSPDASAAVGQHKAFLDIIEKDLFQSHMRSVTYLRLDGSVQTEKRFEIVKSFNSDPTIDVLLLTTHVGGLGLNLTSADTLVFMEHDWNPMKDLQAMDRAHRLGQKKVVNVHRLIMRGTLEEKVMSLQRFKVSVANAVINAENASLKTMNTDQLLDLFTSTPASRKASVLPSSSSGEESKESKGKSGRKGLKSILSGLDELWDQSQYADEYDLNQFLAKLNGFVHALDERERLLVTTEWLVKYIARTYTGMGTAFEDLLQAGTMGVLDGAERFDSEKGCKFSTYVKYWIRKAMLALLAEDSGVIQLPARMESIIRKMKEAKRVIRSSMGKNPIDAEIATFIGVSVSNIRLARKCSRRVVSLYAEVGTGQNAKFIEVTPDTSLEAPDEAIFRRQMKERLLLVLDKLPAREGRVLKLRHGLKDGKCRSLEQIGGIYHVSKEWIRKIEMSKLRNEDVHHELKDFCGF